MNRGLTSSLASLAGVAAFSLAAQEADAQCRNPNGFPVLHQVAEPGGYTELPGEIINQYNIKVFDLVRSQNCRPDKLGLILMNYNYLSNAGQNPEDNPYDNPYIFTNCSPDSGLNIVSTPETALQPTITVCNSDGDDCHPEVILDFELSPDPNIVFSRTMAMDETYGNSGKYAVQETVQEHGRRVWIRNAHQANDDNSTTFFVGASVNNNGRGELTSYNPGNNGYTNETAFPDPLPEFFRQPFSTIHRPGGGVHLSGIRSLGRQPHIITIEFNPDTNSINICGNRVNPVVDSEGRAVDTNNYSLVWRDVHDIYENTHTVGFVLNPDEEDPNGFKLFATVDLNTCNFTGCTAEETCNENTGVCERTDVNIDPCAGAVCGTGETCIEGVCAPDQEADAGEDTGADTGDTGLDTDAEIDADMGDEDATDLTDDTDLEEDSDADMADEPDAQPDMPEEDVANSDTGDADAEDPYHPDNNGNNGNPDAGICTRAATECKPGEEMVNNGGACACVPVDTPDLTPDTGTDSGNNERPPAPKPKEEGCATVPGDIQGKYGNLILLAAGLAWVHSRRKTAA